MPYAPRPLARVLVDVKETPFKRLQDGRWENKKMLHVVCDGSHYQAVELLNNESTDEIQRAFQACWTRHFQWPRELKFDQAKGFVGAAMREACEQHGVLGVQIAGEAQWQNGKA